MSLTKTELKDIQSLLTKKGRKLKKTFVAEGVRLLEEAVRAGIRPTCVCASDAALSDRGRHLVRQFDAAGVRVESIPLRQLESIADTDTTQGILATFSLPRTDLAELYRPAMRRVLLCENIGDPGNLGTLLRSAKAFRLDLVILAGRSADAYSPKVVRASAGAIFGLPIVDAGVDEVLTFFESRQAQLIAADSHGTATWKGIVPPTAGPQVLAVGSEADGLSPELSRRADFRVRIDHADTVESLNAAVAGSIIMYEMYRVQK